jgi:hypothetical protein
LTAACGARKRTARCVGDTAQRLRGFGLTS